MSKNKNGDFSSKSTMKITATETSRKVEFEIPKEEQENVTAGLLKNNHLRDLYKDYCILNQEFLRYVLSCSNLTGTPLKILIFLISVMDKENKVLTDYKEIGTALKMNPKQADNGLRALVKAKIVIKRKGFDVFRRNEIALNYDILNPQLAFKNKSTKQNVAFHKALMNQETPYIKQYNTDGHLDFVNTETGEIFITKRLIK